MRIVFSVYHNDVEDNTKEVIYNKLVETHISNREIENRLELQDLYAFVVEGGDGLFFWDITCFFEETKDLINRINAIPCTQTKQFPPNVSKVFIIENIEPWDAKFLDNVSDMQPHMLHYDRYERGCNSYYFLAMWASEHPFLMIFISGIVWDLIKIIFKKPAKIIKSWFGLINTNNIEAKEKRMVCLNAKKFYSNFETMTKIPQDDVRIVSIKRRKNNLYEVQVRTLQHKTFRVNSSAMGKIISLYELKE